MNTSNEGAPVGQNAAPAPRNELGCNPNVFAVGGRSSIVSPAGMPVSAKEGVAGKSILRSSACSRHLYCACAVFSKADKSCTGKEIPAGKRKCDGGSFPAHCNRGEEYVITLYAHISLSLDVGPQSVLIKPRFNHKPGNPSFAIAFKPSDAIGTLLH